MTVSIGISPCPNDTFIFDALLNSKINTGDLQFELHFADVQTLNEWALQGRLDLTKISYGVWPLLQQNYRLLHSGGAMGYGVGPLLISRSPVPEAAAERNALVESSSIVLPGQHTTAHLLFTHAFPKAVNKTFLPFHEIETAVLNGSFDMGVIIHENRFTYQQKGLQLVADLGTLWEQQTGLPIPLGGIAAHKRIPEETAAAIDRMIAASVTAAWNNYPELSPFVIEHAQEMSEAVMRQHIELYVNGFTGHAGTEGAMAVSQLLNVYEIMQQQTGN